MKKKTHTEERRKNLALIELAAIYVEESANIMESH